jgi:hypothetical protein
MPSALDYLLDLIWIPILIAQWVGVTALRKSGRTPAWWHMFVGVVFVSLSLISQYLLVPYLSNVLDRGYQDLFSQIRSIASMLVASGFLLFSIGFALHSLRAANLSARITELELMNLAQATELERLRNR